MDSIQRIRFFPSDGGILKWMDNVIRSSLVAAVGNISRTGVEQLERDIRPTRHGQLPHPLAAVLVSSRPPFALPLPLHKPCVDSIAARIRGRAARTGCKERTVSSAAHAEIGHA